MDIFEAEMARRFVVAVEKIANALDRKTEPQNYCDDCLYRDTCDSKEFFYACTSKATISKMEQVDKDINVRSKDEPQTEVETMSCAECKHRPIGAEICEEPCHYEPQTDCAWK